MVDAYQDIISLKYSREGMQLLFSERNVIRTWRLCWVALAEAERELGLKQISKEMIDELRKNVNNIDFAAAREKEKETAHDVMAHIFAYGLACPKAKGIIHLGATSQYVKCNTDLILQHQALIIIRQGLVGVLERFLALIEKTKSIPTLSYTHLQPAQPTTIGRRFCNYAQDLLMDVREIGRILEDFALLGAKGATGTQASFLRLFNDPAKVKKLDVLVTKKLGFTKTFPISTQTYPRKFDIRIASVLASICASCKRFATDLRLLTAAGVVEEQFGAKQTGSSAMPYKRNPITSERICSLARRVMNTVADFYEVHAEQWLERTLDDSAVRRIDIPENFLLTDYILSLMDRLVAGLAVFEGRSRELVDEMTPFLATEDILMECVKKGADRQVVHERLKAHAMAARNGSPKDLIVRLSEDKGIPLRKDELGKMLSSSSLIGLSVSQAESFCKEQLRPALRKTGKKGR